MTERACRVFRSPGGRAAARVVVCLLVIFAAGCELSAQADSSVPVADARAPAWTTDLDARLPRLMRRFGVPGLQVIVLTGGTPVWRAAYGEADPATARPMRLDTPMRVESISKPVTAWGVMRLVQTGQLALDDTVSHRLSAGVLSADVPAFTVRQLLAHTAGVGLGDFAARFPPAGPVPTVAEQVVREFAMPWVPGAGFHYSDTGYLLLELLVEEVTGERFADRLAREVLAPLGMDRATFDLTPALARDLAVAHSLRGEPIAPYVYPGRGSGGLIATAEDVARWLGASADGAPRPVLTDASVRVLHAPVTVPDALFRLVADGYALGHFTETLSDGRAAVWHGGQGFGWMTHAHLVPTTGDGIVLLANSQRAWPLFARVLAEWSRAIGVAPVGMARVRWGTPAAWSASGLAVVVALAVAITRPASRRRAAMRLAAALSILAGVGWAATRDYLFVFSVIPDVIGWVAAALLTLAVALMVSAWRGVRGASRGWSVAVALVVGVLAPMSADAQTTDARMASHWTAPVAATIEVRHQLATPVTQARSGPYEEATITVWRATTFLPWVHRGGRTTIAGRLAASRHELADRPEGSRAFRNRCVSWQTTVSHARSFGRTICSRGFA